MGDGRKNVLVSTLIHTSYGVIGLESPFVTDCKCGIKRHLQTCPVTITA